MKKSDLIQQFVKAAEKQKFTLNNGGLGHASWCNFQRPHTECHRCNCGINDLQTVLDSYNNQLREFKLHNIKRKLK